MDCSSFPPFCPPVAFDASSSTPSTSTIEHPNKDHIFDVFINHRGPDVKKNFASHLYRHLHSRGLRVFLDREELQRGENLTSQIEGAIATASVHVAIFSHGYAESKWCLDELVLMLNSGNPVIPVFYGVKPAELRWTRSEHGVYAKVLRILWWWPWGKAGVYEHALLNLERKKTFDPQTNKEKPRYEANTIENWRKGLSRAAEISGFELEACHSDEGELLNKVVEQVQEIVRRTPLNVARYSTRLKENLKALDEMVSLGIRKWNCLLEVENGNRISMHNDVRDLGRYSAEKEPPGRRRRLWCPIDNLNQQNVPDQSSGDKISVGSSDIHGFYLFGKKLTPSDTFIIPSSYTHKGVKISVGSFDIHGSYWFEKKLTPGDTCRHRSAFIIPKKDAENGFLGTRWTPQVFPVIDVDRRRRLEKKFTFCYRESNSNYTFGKGWGNFLKDRAPNVGDTVKFFWDNKNGQLLITCLPRAASEEVVSTDLRLGQC